MSKFKPISFGDIEVQFCLDANDTNGQMTVFECRIWPGAKVPVPHYHEAFDETIYVLEGTGAFNLGAEVLELNAGESLFIPRGVPHGFINKTDSLLRFLAMATPGILGESFFIGVAEVLNADGPPDMPKLMAVMGKHGLVPVKS